MYIYPCLHVFIIIRYATRETSKIYKNKSDYMHPCLCPLELR